jgi:uncharacterized protein
MFWSNVPVASLFITEMRKATAFIILVLSFYVCASAQETNNVPLITVGGEAEVRVLPDEVILSLGVETSSKMMEEAKSQNDERVRRALALGKDFGIEAKYIQTDFITVEPWYRDGVTRPENLEYRVRKTIVMTLKDISKFESLLSKALEAGVTHVHGIQFRTTELHKYRDQARALAIKAAREKAIALASELGQKVGRAYRISEYSGGWYSPYGMWWGQSWRGGGMSQISVQGGGGNAATNDGAIALGQITVTANVSVSFLLE